LAERYSGKAGGRGQHFSLYTARVSRIFSRASQSFVVHDGRRVECVEHDAQLALQTLVANTAGCMRAAVATATDQATEMADGKGSHTLSHLFGIGSERERGNDGTREEQRFDQFGTRH
jgi:hypothetical protein